MTWQRIDDDTYIDDTLVTCAEYQLFIDDMYEQGKDYQPDHWPLRLFPEGTALSPILGLRHLDATAFCDWLTRQKAGEWLYRLPHRKETKYISIKSLGSSVPGCWLKEDFQFSWIDNIPIDARQVRIFIDFINEVDLASALERNRNRPLDINYSLSIAAKINLVVTSDLIESIVSCSESIRARFQTHRNIDHIYHLIQDVIIKIHRTLIRMNQSSQDENYETMKHSLDYGTDVIIDIYTLQERIAGRSPAFEGVCLVRERTK